MREGHTERSRLLHWATPSDGFTALWERGRLDLTVEALVLRDDLRGLFSDQDCDVAEQRLRDYGWGPDELSRARSNTL